MPLDPTMAMILQETPELPDMADMTPQAARDWVNQMHEAAGEGVDVPNARVIDRIVANDIPVRLYYPSEASPLPLLVFYHGGGWVIGDLTGRDLLCRKLANQAQCAVMSVDYRLAPEHPYPAPLDDCYAATVWAIEHATEIGIDPSRVAIGGESAGGNLAACVAIKAAQQQGPELAFQLLIYPVTAANFDSPSYIENAEGYMLTRASMYWFWDQYLLDPSKRDDPLVSPLCAEDLSGLPPAHIITAEFDPLRDEGEAYAKKLANHGVDVTVTRYDGVIHGFLGMSDILPPAQTALTECCTQLQNALGA